MKVRANVLLVDDQREFAADLAERMTRRNFSVNCAHSGREALAQLEKDKDTEVVILDYKMPGLDGLETLKLIRKKQPLVEVIMLSGQSTIDSAVKAIKMGAYDYLLKPIVMEELVSKVDKAANRKRKRDQLILEVHMTPYLTPREREARIARVLDPGTNSGGE